MKNVNILGVKITSSAVEDILVQLKCVLESSAREGYYVCATSVHGVIEAQSDPDFRDILNGAYINHADGLPLAKVGCWLGAKQMEQVRGPDLFPAVCEMTENMQVKHYFYGGEDGVADQLVACMRERFPKIKIAGTYCPPFRPLTVDEKNEIMKRINNAGADIVWVGLSTPKQEKWMHEFHDKCGVKLMFSVGAAFDFHTNRIKFAPRWLRMCGLEWFYRLCSEPNRLWKRYVKIVPSFIYLSAQQLLTEKLMRKTRSR